MIEECFYADRDRMFAALAKTCRRQLSGALNDRGSAVFLASGGGTPVPLYHALARSTLDWPRIKVALVDERWVAVDHSHSNEGLLRRSLLRQEAETAPFVGMKSDANTAREGLAECEQRYLRLGEIYDVAILGMGNDGHTASLFPGTDGLAAAMNPEGTTLCTAIDALRNGVDSPDRLSLTLPALQRSRLLVLLLTGDTKLETYRKALQVDDALDMPVAAVLRQQQTPVAVYWAP